MWAFSASSSVLLKTSNPTRQESKQRSTIALATTLTASAQPGKVTLSHWRRWSGPAADAMVTVKSSMLPGSATSMSSQRRETSSSRPITRGCGNFCSWSFVGRVSWRKQLTTTTGMESSPSLFVASASASLFCLSLWLPSASRAFSSLACRSGPADAVFAFAPAHRSSTLTESTHHTHQNLRDHPCERAWPGVGQNSWAAVQAAS
mmetsp:Transcript_60931/g.108231  ORF Transcript_60931/g.108231 Transcript_60931/m.108231 type:complete len:205 (+) Transcript_60931:1300-1914(+)